LAHNCATWHANRYANQSTEGRSGPLGQRKAIKKKDKFPGENQARFVSLIEYLDLKVGQVVIKIDELGIADNTVIIFLSDNGTAVTVKTRGVKRGAHVVQIAAGAGIKKRGVTAELSDFSDIAPYPN